MNALSNYDPFFYVRIFEQNPVAMVVVTCEGILLKANKRAKLLQQTISDHLFGASLLRNPCVLQKLNARREFYELNISVDQAGNRREYRIDGYPIHRYFRRFIILTIQEMTKITDQIKELSYIASHDPLTKVLNRRGFIKEVEAPMAEAAKLGYTLMVLYIDVNNFKHINSTYGHEAGDVVLAHIASLLSRIIGDQGFVGRLGGDEFAVCTSAISSYMDVNDTILSVFSMIRFVKVPYKGHVIQVRASCGATLYMGAGDDAASMLDRADKAMYKMKESTTG